MAHIISISRTMINEPTNPVYSVSGETIINADEEHGTLLIVQKGTVRIMTQHQGQDIPLTECHESDIIGEMSMIDGKGASAAVVAETEVEVAIVGQTDIARLAQADPEFGMRIYQSLALSVVKRLRKLNTEYLPFELYG